CEIAMPWFNALVAASVTSELVIAGDSILILVLMSVLIGLGAGLYPAVTVARLSPQDALSGEIIKGVSSARYRSGLIVLQFSISIGLIIAAGIVNTQINYALSKSLGFDPENVVTIELPVPAWSAYNSLRAELRNVPGVIAVSGGSTLPTRDLSDGDAIVPPGGDSNQPLLVRTVMVEDDYFSTLGMPIVAGRALDDDYPSDFMGMYSPTNTDRVGGVVLNETAARRAGYLNPEDAIGEHFRQEGQFTGINFTSDYTVVGVVQDAHFGSIRQEIASISFIQADSPNVMMIRISAENQSQTLAAIDLVMQTLLADVQFAREFLSANYSAFYSGEERTFTLFIVLSVLAIGIACLGLYAVTAFIAERRTREISIRKVLGASVQNLVSLLTWDFSRLVLVANVVAWPLAWLAMQQWLSNFAYRADVSMLIFLFAGLVTFAMAVITTMQRAWIAAQANPVNSLRAE
ncbi:MAG: FtsX-like permease family protein, partial [Pseudohongiellaceae bacterium]